MADTTSTSAALRGTTALVTGASSGIGEATARHLASLGADVALVARRRDRIESLAKEIVADGARALVIEADVTDRVQAEAAVQRTVDELGRLDILVNNAGVMLLGPMADAPVEEWEQMVHVNVLGLLYCAKAALPHLLAAAESSERGVADLVNISSVAGRVVRPAAASTTPPSTPSAPSARGCGRRSPGATSGSGSSSRAPSPPS